MNRKKEKIYLNFFIPIIIMGITSILIQITVLRLLLSTFSGNELDIGITLSFWLTWVGLGSYMGGKIKFKHAFALSFIIAALLLQPTVFAIKAVRPVLSLELGEAVSFVSTILSTALTLFPLCFVLGLQFPLAVSYAGEYNSITTVKDTAGKVYGLEALGAFIGGVLFTFVVSGSIGAIELCSILALISILMAVYISKKKILALFFVFPVALYFGLHKTVTSLPWQGMKPSQVVESKYGEITVIKIGEQSSIYGNGQLFFTYPDQPGDEFRTHLPMALHPSPSKILVLGGSPGTIKEFLKYPVELVDFIELNPKIIRVSLELLGMHEDKDAVNDPRVKIIIEDGRRFIKRSKNATYDLIVLNLPPPSTAGINRFYTSNFFREVKGVLNDGGILAVTLPQSTGYIGRSMQTANGSIYNSMKSVFNHVEVTAQEYGGFFASDTPIDTDPETLEKRFVQRAVQTKHFNQYIFRDAFSPLNVDYVRKRLGDIKFVNTDSQPSAYLYNLMLWSEVHGGRALRYLFEVRELHIILISLVILLFVLLSTFRQKRRVVYFSIFTTGFSSMALMLVIIFAYQASYGYVYEMIGMLTATFMVGIFAGAYLSGYVKRALQTLFYLELMTITLALISSMFFRAEPLFYVLILLLGLITGRQFSAANLCLDEPGVAGKLYGIDLVGSFLGAFIPSIVLIPLFGSFHTLLFIAGMKTFSAVMILSVKDR
jgi:spermidine synthase